VCWQGNDSASQPYQGKIMSDAALLGVTSKEQAATLFYVLVAQGSTSDTTRYVYGQLQAQVSAVKELHRKVRIRCVSTPQRLQP
jgi:hypothetical protein